MKSFGISESLIFSGTALLIAGMITHGWILVGSGILTGFVRYTTWFGLQQNSEIE